MHRDTHTCMCSRIRVTYHAPCPPHRSTLPAAVHPRRRTGRRGHPDSELGARPAPQIEPFAQRSFHYHCSRKGRTRESGRHKTQQNTRGRGVTKGRVEQRQNTPWGERWEEVRSMPSMQSGNGKHEEERGRGQALTTPYAQTGRMDAVPIETELPLPHSSHSVHK